MTSWEKSRRALARVKRGGSFQSAVADALGVEITKELGRGYYGVVYLLKGGRVLKVTTDQSEALFGQWLHTHQTMKGATRSTPARAAFPRIHRVATNVKHRLDFIVRENCTPLRAHPDFRGTDHTLDRRQRLFESFCRRIVQYYTSRSRPRRAKYGAEAQELLDEMIAYDKRFQFVAEGIYDLAAEEGAWLEDVHADNVGFRMRAVRGYPPVGSAVILDWGQAKGVTRVVGDRLTLPNPSSIEQVCIADKQPV